MVFFDLLNLPKYSIMQKDNYLENIEDFVKNNSVIYEINIKIQNKYFSKKMLNTIFIKMIYTMIINFKR